MAMDVLRLTVIKMDNGIMRFARGPKEDRWLSLLEICCCFWVELPRLLDTPSEVGNCFFHHFGGSVVVVVD